MAKKNQTVDAVNAEATEVMSEDLRAQQYAAQVSELDNLFKQGVISKADHTSGLKRAKAMSEGRKVSTTEDADIVPLPTDISSVDLVLRIDGREYKVIPDAVSHQFRKDIKSRWLKMLFLYDRGTETINPSTVEFAISKQHEGCVLMRSGTAGSLNAEAENSRWSNMARLHIAFNGIS